MLAHAAALALPALTPTARKSSVPQTQAPWRAVRSCSSANKGLPLRLAAIRSTVGREGAIPGSGADEVVQRRERERLRHHPLQPIVRRRTVESEGRAARPGGHDHTHRWREPPHGELQGMHRGAIEPLNVVDRDNDGSIGREQSEDPYDGGSGSPGIASAVDLCPQ
jgi:hypothetical protein